MAYRRRFAALLGALLAMVPAGCGSDAVGVDDCREIENARCEAAFRCGDRFTFTDADACKRFYRTQCLHGLAASKAPSTAELRSCVSIVQAAGSCAATSTTTPLADCGDTALAAQTNPNLIVACDVVQFPEYTTECAFLAAAASAPADAGAETAQQSTDSGEAETDGE